MSLRFQKVTPAKRHGSAKCGHRKRTQTALFRNQPQQTKDFAVRLEPAVQGRHMARTRQSHGAIEYLIGMQSKRRLTQRIAYPARLTGALPCRRAVGPACFQIGARRRNPSLARLYL